MPDYADLIIEFSRQGEKQYWVRLSYSQPDEQAQIAPQSGLAAFDFEKLRLSALKPEAYGKLLREATYPSEALRAFYQSCLAASGQAGKELRPRILIDRSALELHNLRWETLRDLDDQGFLAADADRPFSRFLATTDWRRVELRSRGRLRALVVIANPAELRSPAGLALGEQQLAPVDVQAEAQRALDSLRETPQAQGIQGVPTVTFLGDAGLLPNPPGGPASLAAIRSHLLQGFDILYLVAHGALLPDQPENPASAASSFLLLESEDGASYHICPGEELIDAVASLPLLKRPRLVVLASCQSGGKGIVPSGEADESESSQDKGALAALGPRLAAVGVPAVLAMQDNIKMKSTAQFMPVFFSQLLEHGQVDKAVAVARQALIQSKASDWWVPVLYLRLLGGALWFDPGFTSQGEYEGWPGILNSLDKEMCVPILGSGLLEPLIGSTREIARYWAESAGYPLEPHSKDELTQVAQYLSNKHRAAYPRDQLLKYIHSHLIAEYKLPEEQHKNLPLEKLIVQIADEVLKDPEHTYNILARLPVKIYINASPDNLLEIALRRNDRDPLVMHSCWGKGMGVAEMREASKQLGEVSVKRPLVYQLFGKISLPRSMVLSEDDYFEYLMWVNNPVAEILLPEPVINAWRDGSLLFLGFQMDDWSFRALFRSILYGDRRGSIRDYPSVAVQLQPGGGYLNADSARAYLANTFRNDQVDIYWGSGEDFLSELNRQMQDK